MVRRDALLGGAAALSLAIHALVALMLIRLPTSAVVAPRKALGAASYQVELEAHAGREGTPGAPRRGDAPTGAARAVPGGDRSAQNIDAVDPGQRGDRHGDAEAILLMQRAEGVVLFDSPLNNLAAAQTQRIRTARDRATLERRRATPSPHDEVFLASGPGTHRERRPVSAVDAAEGARVAPAASAAGTAPSRERGGATRAVHGARAAPAPAPASAEARGAEVASPGRGILGGEGVRRSEA
ncbi:MAG TPA: hypothetical protein VIL20_01035, partial [Sandaracinaceae bacterium]